MKHLIKNLIYAKVGVGAVGAFVARRMKNQAVSAIERSEFNILMQRLKQHPSSQRKDGFYRTSYQFKKTLEDGSTIFAITEKHKPTENISLNDSLEIIHQTDSVSNRVKLTVKTRPWLKSELIPQIINMGLLGVYYVDRDGSDAEIEHAFKVLSHSLQEKEQADVD